MSEPIEYRGEMVVGEFSYTCTFTLVPPPTDAEIVERATADVRRLRAMGNPRKAWKAKRRAERILASRQQQRQ